MCALFSLFHGAVLLLLLQTSGLAAAHDVWIEPRAFRPAPDSTVAVALRVGHGFPGEPQLPRPDRIERVFVQGPLGEQPFAAAPAGESLGLARIGPPGLYVVAYRSRPARIELAADKFESYLKEEGLEAVRRARAERGESQRPGRERYSRCAKALLLAGADSGGPADRAVGLPLELVAEASPFELPRGGRLPLRLLLNGQPLADAMISAHSRSDPAQDLSARTDENGRVALRLNADGFWLIAAVHMFRVTDAPDVEWESLWASLTFELAENPATPHTRPAAGQP